MIAQLRRRHRMMMTLLALFVVALFAWALRARREFPTVDHPPGANAPATEAARNPP